MKPHEPTDSKNESEKPKRKFERPEPSKLFDSEYRDFYESEEFQVVANEVMFPEQRRRSGNLLKQYNVKAIQEGPQDIANEALRRTFEKFPGKIHELENTASERRAYFKNLLNRIAENLTFSLIRTIRRKQIDLGSISLEDEVNIPHPAGSQISLLKELEVPAEQLSDKVVKVREASMQLSETDQAVLRMRYEEEATYPEIAERLNVSPGSARVRGSRILRRIRKWFLEGGRNE